MAATKATAKKSEAFYTTAWLFGDGDLSSLSDKPDINWSETE